LSRRSRAELRRSPPSFLQNFGEAKAEEVGLEPTNGFLDRYGLANRWNDHYPTPPSVIILSFKIIKVNLNLGNFSDKFKECLRP
jgi:hypothetical protein